MNEAGEVNTTSAREMRWSRILGTNAAPVTPEGEDAELVRPVARLLQAQCEIDALAFIADDVDHDWCIGGLLDDWWIAAREIARRSARTPIGLRAKANAMLSTLGRCVCDKLGSALKDIG
jgi:hypothetical protein